jgi:RimJ/RimL family protein N-acetyltransferase
LEVERLRLLVRHANNRNVWLNLRRQISSSLHEDDAKRWLEIATEIKPETNFAIAVEGVAIGAIGFSVQSDVAYRSAEIGYWLGEEFWGRGIATEALMAVTDYAFASYDLCRLYAHVFEWNLASARVLKSGYTLEGRLKKSVTKDKQTIDQLLYARTID